MEKISKTLNMKYYFWVFFITFSSNYSFAQKQYIVETEGIKTELQKNNLGKIFFTDRKIAIEDLKQQNFLNSYKLTNKSNLFFIAYFDNSLTN